MKNYYPERMELGPRDIVARANYNEIVAGRGTSVSAHRLSIPPSTNNV
jgi:succinate dehydrogenase/fumarate reductase flavoprotein subunit